MHDGGLGMLEGNEITGNGFSGVEVETTGSPAVRGNRINRNMGRGGERPPWRKGDVEDNDLAGNGGGAWYIDSDSEPNVTRARNKE